MTIQRYHENVKYLSIIIFDVRWSWISQWNIHSGLKIYRWICLISIIPEGIKIYWLLKVSVFKYACRQIVCFCYLLHYMYHIRWICVWQIICVFFCFRFIRIFGFCIFLSKSFSLKALVIKNASKCPGLFSYIVLKVMISYPSMSMVFTLFIVNGLAKSGMSCQG